MSGIEAAERLGDILAEKGYMEIFRLAPQEKDWNEVLKQRYGAEFLPAVPHERKEIYLQSVAALSEMKINPNRIANDLIAAYNSADRVRLAEFSLAASEHFLRIEGVDFPLDKMKERLTNEYKSYLDNGSLSVKLGKLQDAMPTGLEQLRKPAQTAAELKITARKLYDIADHALRLATEETLTQRAEQKETPEETTLDELQFINFFFVCSANKIIKVYIRSPRKLILGLKINYTTNQIQSQTVTHSAVTIGIFHNFKNLDLSIDVFNENAFM